MLFSDAYDQPVTTLCPSGTTIEDMTAIIASDMVRNCHGPVTVGDRISTHSCQRSRVSMQRLAMRSCCKVFRTYPELQHFILPKYASSRIGHRSQREHRGALKPTILRQEISSNPRVRTSLRSWGATIHVTALLRFAMQIILTIPPPKDRTGFGDAHVTR